jgi:antitoxin HicB
MYYHFQVNQEENGYWANCIELKGCVTEGDTLLELEKNMEEVLDLYLDDLETLELPLPLSDSNFKDQINIKKVPVDVKKAFALNIKKARLEKGLTQNELAKKLGLNNIYSYQRLESPKKANPSLILLNKLKKILPELNIEMILT